MPEDHLKYIVFYIPLDCIIGNVMRHYDALQKLYATFRFPCIYATMHLEEIGEQRSMFHEVGC
jgi:hypothetical protein